MEKKKMGKKKKKTDRLYGRKIAITDGGREIMKGVVIKPIITPPIGVNKIFSEMQQPGIKIAKRMDGEITVSKFSVGQVVKLKDSDFLLLENEALTYQMEEGSLRSIANAQVSIHKVLNLRQLRKDGKPVFWYEVGQWGRNVVDVPEDFLEELPEPVNIPLKTKKERNNRRNQ